MLVRSFINDICAGFIEWAREQMETYTEMFRKQVYGSDVDLKKAQDAIKITYLQSKRVRCTSRVLIVVTHEVITKATGGVWLGLQVPS